MLGYGQRTTMGLDRLKDQEAGGLGRSMEGRGLQMNALGRYDEILRGDGPSVAQIQQQQAGQANAAAQRQAMAAARGGGIGAQMRQIGQIGSAQANQTAGQNAILRAQEQAQALGGYSGLASQMQQAGQAEQMGYAGLLGQGQSADLGAQQFEANLDFQKEQWDFNKKMQMAQMGMDMAKTAAGPFGMMSDERVKDAVESNPMAAAEAVGEIDPKTYSYKPGFGPYGKRVGFTAQDLERTPYGAQLVHETPMGKAVDVPGVASLSLAATADQEHRLRALEGALARPQGGQVQEATRYALGRR
jgi:hypothetical protein